MNCETEAKRIRDLCERASSEHVTRDPVQPKPRVQRLTKEQNLQIEDMYAQGLGPKEIATSMGLLVWTVHHRLNRAGVKRRPAVSDEQLKRAIELRGLGWSYDKIAKEVGSSYGTIRSRLISPLPK